MFLILKFGGTSVGSAKRIKELVNITVNSTPKIVVLSAMSGTTNALVDICQKLNEQNATKATDLINQLKENYSHVISELFNTTDGLNKATQLLNTHFNFMLSFTLDVFTKNEEKVILAQGELLSTALFHFYLEESGISSEIIPALNFMKLNENEEPDSDYIEKYLKKN